MPDHVMPLRGFKGAGVLEVMEDHDGDTYRAVYTVKLAGVVYHAADHDQADPPKATRGTVAASAKE
jgi:phage-related protein